MSWGPSESEIYPCLAKSFYALCDLRQERSSGPSIVAGLNCSESLLTVWEYRQLLNLLEIFLSVL
jgi:hypothetical protein